MNKLEVFRGITEAIVNGLSSNEREKDQKSNTKYYTKTLSNLLDKLFHYQDEDDDEVKEDRRMELVERIIGNNQKSTLNHMKKVLVKRDSIYQEDDQNHCQSYKAFNNLIN